MGNKARFHYDFDRIDEKIKHYNFNSTEFMPKSYGIDNQDENTI